jgi:hypothetical protein
LAAFFLATITSSDEKVFREGLWVKPCVETNSPPNVNLLTGGVTSLVGNRCVSTFKRSLADEVSLTSCFLMLWEAVLREPRTHRQASATASGVTTSMLSATVLLNVQDQKPFVNPSSRKNSFFSQSLGRALAA